MFTFDKWLRRLHSGKRRMIMLPAKVPTKIRDKIIQHIIPLDEFSPTKIHLDKPHRIVNVNMLDVKEIREQIISSPLPCVLFGELFTPDGTFLDFGEKIPRSLLDNSLPESPAAKTTTEEYKAYLAGRHKIYDRYVTKSSQIAS